MSIGKGSWFLVSSPLLIRAENEKKKNLGLVFFVNSRSSGFPVSVPLVLFAKWFLVSFSGSGAPSCYLDAIWEGDY